jgi:hypothetical protein
VLEPTVLDGASPLDHATRFLDEGPVLSWEAPTRSRPRLLVRRALHRVLRPYEMRHTEFDEAVTRNLRDLQWRVAALQAARPTAAADAAAPDTEATPC